MGRKHCIGSSFCEPQGEKAKWQMIHRFKHHRMAQGKLGATEKYPYTVTQIPQVHTQTDKLRGTRILSIHAHMLPCKHTHSDTLAVSHFRGRFLWDLHFHKAPPYVALFCTHLEDNSECILQGLLTLQVDRLLKGTIRLDQAATSSSKKSKRKVCIFSDIQQGANPVVARRSPIVLKSMRKWPYVLLDLLLQEIFLAWQDGLKG